MKKTKIMPLVILTLLIMSTAFAMFPLNAKAHFFDPGGGDDDGSGGDTSAPHIAIISPTATEISGIVTIKAAASDNVGVTKVRFYIDGAYKRTDYSSYYTYSWNTNSYALGSSHSVKAIAYDAAGNAKTTTKSYTIVDNVKPTIDITINDEFDFVYKPENDVYGDVVVVASVSDNRGMDRVEFFIDDILKKSDTDSPYTFFFDSKKYNLGDYVLKAIAYDESGNSKSVSETIHVTYHEESESFLGSYETLHSDQSIAYSLVETDYAQIRSELFFWSAAPDNGKITVNLNLVTVYSWKGSREIAEWKKDIPGEYTDGVCDDVYIEMEETSSTYQDDCYAIFETYGDADSLVWPIGFSYHKEALPILETILRTIIGKAIGALLSSAPSPVGWVVGQLVSYLLDNAFERAEDSDDVYDTLNEGRRTAKLHFCNDEFNQKSVEYPDGTMDFAFEFMQSQNIDFVIENPVPDGAIVGLNFHTQGFYHDTTSVYPDDMSYNGETILLNLPAFSAEFIKSTIVY